MSEPLDDVFAAAEGGAVQGNLARDWPTGRIEWFVAAGLLVEAAPPALCDCTACPGDPPWPVVFDGATAWLPCPNCGVHRIDPWRLRRWRIDWPGFLDALFPDYRGSIEEVHTGRLWRCGRLPFRTGSRPLWFGSGLNRRDGPRLLDEARLPARAIVCTPRDRPLAEPPPGGAFVTLSAVTCWTDRGIDWNPDALDELVPPDPETTPVRRRRRETRSTDIAALTGEMHAHLLAARDHAFHTETTEGAPRLLPRPLQKDLAKRLGMHESRVSRSLADVNATELRILWETADDLVEVLRYRR